MERIWAAGIGALNYWTGRMPDESRYRWATRLGRMSRWVTPAKLRAVEANLAVINSWAGTRFAPHEVFESFGVTLSDFLSGARPALRVEGREKAEDARRAGRGVILLGSHLGYWELGGRILSDWGWPATAVYQPYRSKAMRDFIQKRRAAGIRYLAVGKGAAAGVARVLQRRETAAIIGDRPFGEAGEEVSLCGRAARLPRGPFLFACRYGAPVVPGFVVREKPGEYRAIVEEALWPSGRGETALKDLLQRVSRVLEKYIAAFGDQWHCFEPVWPFPHGTSTECP